MPINEDDKTERIVALLRFIDLAYTAAKHGMTSQQIVELLGATLSAVYSMMVDHFGSDHASEILTAVAKVEAGLLSEGALCDRH